MVEHPKSKSIGSFNRPDVSPCAKSLCGLGEPKFFLVLLDGLREVLHKRLVGHVLEVGVEGDLRLHEGAGPKEEYLLRDPLSNLIFKILLS